MTWNRTTQLQTAMDNALESVGEVCRIGVSPLGIYFCGIMEDYNVVLMGDNLILASGRTLSEMSDGIRDLDRGDES